MSFVRINRRALRYCSQTHSHQLGQPEIQNLRLTALVTKNICGLMSDERFLFVRRIQRIGN